MFEQISSQTDFPAMEAGILNFWRVHDTFRKSLDWRRDCPAYVFYDGPPFATGLPHYGHLLAGTIKDVVPRYQTMCGKFVDRTFGWDCHGLPVENEMEKELGISSRHEIEEYGIAKFNEACRGIVLRYTREWREVVERIGRWVDFERGYRTMDKDYMESIWWVFRQLWDKGLVYEGHKILPYCPRCATPLSNFEANQAYSEVQDPAITVRFKVRNAENLYILAWTTTPWTLPSNMALAVGADIEYVKVRDGDAQYLLAASRLPEYYRDQTPEISERMSGSEIAGLTYEPLFPYFASLCEDGAFRVVAADFVSTEDGTGIVHMAPGFGEDDAATCARENIPMVCPVDGECRFTEEVVDYAGRGVKDADKDLIRRLKDEGKLVHHSTCQHNYPHCWRCDSPLIYRAVSTWFVNVESLKERMLKANAQIHWMPEHLRDGRFGNWLANAHDWAVSRNRYWGCPLPIWRSEDGSEAVCIGSIAELEELSGRPVEDLHKHFVDDIELPSKTGGGTLRRVSEVLDCWFESGSMPYAQHHYPFADKEYVEAHFPADFIAEGLDQTRGWFYTLVVLGAALFDRPPFMNVIVNGLILAEDGRKMSKRLKNYPDPQKIMDSYGADALRLCLLSSQVVRAEDLCFTEAGVRGIMRTVILPLWNAASFFTTYARVDNWRPAGTVAAPPAAPVNQLDRWILSRLENTVTNCRKYMDEYDLQHAAASFTGFLDDLTNWYIRRSRRRFWKSQNDLDKGEAYATLHYVLVTFTQVAAPFIPFATEAIYRNLRTDAMPESVHLCDYPVPRQEFLDSDLDRRMGNTMAAVSLGRYLRTQHALRVRQPLAAAILVSADPQTRHDLEATAEVIAEELNVKKVEVSADEEQLVSLSVKANFKRLGPLLGRKMPAAAAAVAALVPAEIRRLRTGEILCLALPDGDTFELSLADVIVHREEREGVCVANEGAVTVALDTRLTDELISEGWAREVVNRLQNLRKDKGFEVADRIVVHAQLPEAALLAVIEHKNYICREVLAETLEFNHAAGKEFETVDINGEVCGFSIEKAVL